MFSPSIPHLGNFSLQNMENIHKTITNQNADLWSPVPLGTPTRHAKSQGLMVIVGGGVERLPGIGE